MWYTVTVQKTVENEDGSETLYIFTGRGKTEDEATEAARAYASMVEYALDVEKWRPSQMPFAREQLYQFIQPAQLDVIEQMNPYAVDIAYSNALAYVQSYVGAMFNVEEIINSEDTTSTGLTLRLALAIQTAIFLLASSPQYAETTELHNQQLHTLLRGLKSGQRNFGKNAQIADPDVRVAVVKLTKTGAKTY